MPIYEYYCPDNHTIYQFYAKTLAQGQTVPQCPHNASYRMQKIVSTFAVTSGRSETDVSAAGANAGAGAEPEDARMEAAMDVMEKEFANVDENDPRAMARMMRRMSELTGEKMEGEMEEVVRKLEEGVDPDTLEEQMGGEAADGGEADDPYGEGTPGESAGKAEGKEPKHRFRARRRAPVRDPKLYDYE